MTKKQDDFSVLSKFIRIAKAAIGLAVYIKRQDSCAGAYVYRVTVLTPTGVSIGLGYLYLDKRSRKLLNWQGLRGDEVRDECLENILVQLASDDWHKGLAPTSVLLAEHASLMNRYGIASLQVKRFLKKYRSEPTFLELATVASDLKKAMAG